MRVRLGEATEAIRRAAADAIDLGQPRRGIAVGVPVVWADTWWFAAVANRQDSPESAWRAFQVAVGDDFFTAEPASTAALVLGESTFVDLWKMRWALLLEQRGFARLALELARESGDEKLVQLVRNALAHDDAGRQVEIPGTRINSPGVSLAQLEITHWNGATDDELAERDARRAGKWRRVWGHLAGATVHVLTHQGFEAGDGTLSVGYELELPGAQRPWGAGWFTLPLAERLPDDLPIGEAHFKAVEEYAGVAVSVVRIATFPAGRTVFETRVAIPAGRRRARAAVARQLAEARRRLVAERASARGSRRTRLDMHRRHFCAHLLFTGWQDLKRVGVSRATRRLFGMGSAPDRDDPRIVTAKSYRKRAAELIDRWRQLGSP